MKKLSSRFGINRAVIPTILSIVGVSAFVAFAMPPQTQSIRRNSTSRSQSITPICTAQALFTASFTGGQDAAPAVVQQWRAFVQSLTPDAYDTVTISGSNDPVGRTLNDAMVVPQIAAAMKKL